VEMKAGTVQLRDAISFKTIFVVAALFLIQTVSSKKYFDDGNEPPKNEFLADSPWPMTHRNSYSQASSNFHGPRKIDHPRAHVNTFSHLRQSSITLAFSGKYDSHGGLRNATRLDNSVIWGVTVSPTDKQSGEVFKVDTSLQYIDSIEREPYSGNMNISRQDDAGMSGAYTIIDANNTFYAPRFSRIYAYGDSGHQMSKIEIKRIYEIPKEILLDDKVEFIVGLTITYDGMIVFCTSYGLVGVISRDFTRESFYRVSNNETISNSIACDENGGIYMVSSKNMYKLQWNPKVNSISAVWTSAYETCEDVSFVRLGLGSGSTPTLMGTKQEDDKFVVITDCQNVMNVVLFWRDKIPEDWVQLEGTKGRRIAAQSPAKFGNLNATSSLSEQSVVVRGYGALVVNNEKELDDNGKPLSPSGMEKFEWDPSKRTLLSVWSNNESIPNGIPTMSASTGLIYAAGLKNNGRWAFVAIDWKDGKRVFIYGYGKGERYDTVYAATEIGHNGNLYTGVVSGIVRMSVSSRSPDFANAVTA